MQAFDYVAARTVDEAVSLLAAKGAQARVLAGGTDLIVQLREGRRNLELVVDVKKVPDVNVLTYDPQNGLNWELPSPATASTATPQSREPTRA